MGKDVNFSKIIKKLDTLYPEAHCALHYSNPLELLIATILSAQCTDVRVNQVTPKLFKKYRSAKDFAEVPLKELEQEIRSTGFFRSKARSIQESARKILEKFHGEVPQTLEELIQLPGVGRKTANVVLGVIFEKAEGVVVDTHVKRLSYRLGFTKQKDPHKIEKDLMKLVPQNRWIDFSHLLILHGRAICKARKPLCEKCLLNKNCPKMGVNIGIGTGRDLSLQKV